MNIKFVGGVSEVGRLGMILEENGTRLLFDYGMSPTKPPKYPEPAPSVDRVFLSHAHIDHSGMIPWLSSRYLPPIMATKATSSITGLLSRDSLKVARAEGYPEHFSKKDIKEMEKSFESINFGTRRTENGFDMEFYSAGHIPGATMFNVKGRSSLLFTGDINTIDTKLVGPCDRPKCDTLVMESTYSGREHPERRNLEKEFLDSIDDVVSSGGKVVLPSFAVGRTQEMLLQLKDTPYDIWLDGMGKEVTRRYLGTKEFINNPRDLKKAFNRANVVHHHFGRKHALKGDVIITTSGMLDGGPVLHYLKHLKNDANSAVFLTGYQVEDTNGRMLKDKGMINISGIKEKIEMKQGFFDFSAHAGNRELREFANSCGPERIVLFHSDKRELLANDLREDDFEVLLPETGEMMEV